MITRIILQSIKRKNKYYNNYIKKQDPFWYERYKFYWSKVRMLISKSKQNHLQAFFQENLKNSKKLWNKINEFINKNQMGMGDGFVSENGAMMTKQRIVANKFNKCFINVAQNLPKDLEESSNKFKNYLKNPNENSFFLKEIEPDEI